MKFDSTARNGETKNNCHSRIFFVTNADVGCHPKWSSEILLFGSKKPYKLNFSAGAELRRSGKSRVACLDAHHGCRVSAEVSNTQFCDYPGSPREIGCGLWTFDFAKEVGFETRTLRPRSQTNQLPKHGNSSYCPTLFERIDFLMLG